jgi:hypothetical protein
LDFNSEVTLSHLTDPREGSLCWFIQGKRQGKVNFYRDRKGLFHITVG